ncbi:hypothetical protein GYMLUDRAFT_557690 [Collybiopsis luxurians FD-317 M1]|uniref:DUF7598 domain-containing protein n=1 Tax=Collybiopsis luxurians FD-317 M1 TaxID=944289 RepID=A0A0D0CRJ5_9AGAR|nr:hypothetical protein GYMLUDRAFT_557690 [Collybiopsis luxurians FD-317 M1]
MLPPRACMFTSFFILGRVSLMNASDTFIGLNVVRALSIIAMILVFASSIEVMVTNIKAVNFYEAHKGENNSTMSAMNMDYIAGSTVPNQPAGIFWAVVSSLLIIFQTVILILSECSWPISFFDHFFPVLGSDFGTGALGIFQCLIGAQILSHHVDEFTLVSAFFLFSLGCLNMLLGLIFRESAKSKRSITSWRKESKAVLPTINDPRPVFVNVSPAFNTGSEFSEKPRLASDFGSFKSTYSDKSGLGFGRQGEKAAGLKGFILQTPEQSLPRYMTPPPPFRRQRRALLRQVHLGLPLPLSHTCRCLRARPR